MGGGVAEAQHRRRSGPTRSSRTSPASRSCWRPRKDYWRPKPYFQRVVLKFVPNEADRVLLLKRKAVDMVAGRPGLSPEEREGARGRGGAQGLQRAGHDLPLALHEPEASRRSTTCRCGRRSTTRSRSRRSCPTCCSATARQMKSPVPNLTPATAATLSPYKHDIDKAKALMKEAGVDKAPIPVDLAMRVGWPTHEQAAVWIQRELEKIGFKVNIVQGDRRHLPPDRHQGRPPALDRGVAVVDQRPVLPPDVPVPLEVEVHQPGASTRTRRVDKLIDENMHETNRDKRVGAPRARPEDRHRRRRVGLALVRQLDARDAAPTSRGVEKRWDTFERYYASSAARRHPAGDEENAHDRGTEGIRARPPARLRRRHAAGITPSCCGCTSTCGWPMTGSTTTRSGRSGAPIPGTSTSIPMATRTTGSRTGCTSGITTARACSS